MNKKKSINAPGLKYIIFMFVLTGLSIFAYIYWYSKVSQSSKNYLVNYLNKFNNQDIYIEWDQIKTKGFPYRIEHKLNNIKVKFYNTILETSSIKLINQPWKLNHFLIKLENNITINYDKTSIKLSNDNLISSLIIEENLNKRISIQSDIINIDFKNESIKLIDPEFHFKESNNLNDEAFLYAKKILLKNKNDIKLNDIKIHSNVLNLKKINIRNLINWSTSGGGIDIKDFNIIIDNNPLRLNGFISLDKNLHMLSSLSIQGKGIENLLEIFNKYNIINSDIYEASNVIIKTTNISSKLIDKDPIYTINSQNGNLTFMKIKLLELPNLQYYLNN